VKQPNQPNQVEQVVVKPKPVDPNSGMKSLFGDVPQTAPQPVKKK